MGNSFFQLTLSHNSFMTKFIYLCFIIFAFIITSCYEQTELDDVDNDSQSEASYDNVDNKSDSQYGSANNVESESLYDELNNSVKTRNKSDSRIILNEYHLSDGITFAQYTGDTRKWHANISYNGMLGQNAALVTSVRDNVVIIVTESYTTFYTDIIAKKSIKFDSDIVLYEDESGLTVEPGSEGMYIKGDLYVHGKISGKLPTTDLDPSQRIPIGATVCLCSLSQNLGVGSIVSGTYTLCSLTGETDPQGHTTNADEEYQLLTSTSANVTYALAMRIL